MRINVVCLSLADLQAVLPIFVVNGPCLHLVVVVVLCRMVDPRSALKKKTTCGVSSVTPATWPGSPSQTISTRE